MTSVGPTRFERRISLRTALRSTARRGGACREAKVCCGVTCIHVVCPSHDGAERQNPLGYFTDGAPDASFGRASSARRFKSAFERWPRCRGPTNMRRVRVVLLQSAIGGAAALRRHTQAGDDDGAHHSPRPLVKTRRYETPEAPAPQTAPETAREASDTHAKVQQVEVGERGAGSGSTTFSADCSRTCRKTHIFRVIRKGEVRVNGKRAKPDTRLLASDIVRVPPVRVGAAAPPRRAPPAMVAGPDRRHRLRGPAAARHRQARRRRRARRQRRELRRHRGAARGAARRDARARASHRSRHQRPPAGRAQARGAAHAARAHARRQSREALSRARRRASGSSGRNASTCRCAPTSAWAASGR